MSDYGEVILGVEAALPVGFNPGFDPTRNRGGGRAWLGKEGRDHGQGAALPLRQLALWALAGSNLAHEP